VGFPNTTRHVDSGSEIEGAGLSLVHAADGCLLVQLTGDWQLRAHLPSTADVEREIASRPPRVSFEAGGLGKWDSSLVTFLVRILAFCRAQGVDAERNGLPGGVRRLLELAEAVPEKKGARRAVSRVTLFERIGVATSNFLDAALEFLGFLGRATLALGVLLRGRACFRRSDFFLIVQQSGAQALGIVSLISFLVGVILAFVGAVQLQQFGASIYVADLVGIAMARDMGAMMTGIVMAGRTGASFAAEIGTMKVNREIDALTTMGIDPMEFLVLPRMIALSLMMPILCLYSDLLGMLGGGVVGALMLDLSWTTYYHETTSAVTLTQIAGGVFKAAVYGTLVAISGCLRGTECGSSASAVGAATTSAVVTSIVLIIGACGLFAVLFYIVGI
jgi:phospholipid/cholesterol/gamma-HCH transport system permease protein